MQWGYGQWGMGRQEMGMTELESMALEMPEVKNHPNRTEFRGVLTVVDVASQRAPSGSKGHRVMLTRAAAEAALPSLLGMALDYAPSFDRHDMQRKVGVITNADIVGRNLEIGGYLYGKDFPDVVEEVGKWGRRLAVVARPREGAGIHASAESESEGASLRASLASAITELRRITENRKEAATSEVLAKANSGALGMSYEVTGVNVANRKARIWELTKVTFTGAAILRRNKAAYEDTWIELGC